MIHSLPNFLPPIVAACQTVGLFGALVVVVVALALEVTDR